MLSIEHLRWQFLYKDDRALHKGIASLTLIYKNAVRFEKGVAPILCVTL